MVRRFLLFSALFLAVLLGSGVSSRDALAADPVKELKYGTTFYYTSLDPAVDWSGWFTLTMGLTETLFKFDEQMQPVPWLAQSYENIDENTWKVTIKDNITFQNGKPMDALAVKKSLERAMQVNSRAPETLRIDTIEVDGSTLTIKTKSPHPTMINALCEPMTSIVYTEDISDLKVYGTGPFKIEEFKPKGNAVVSRFDGYWNGRPKLDGFVWVYMADGGTLTMAMQSGELDAASSIPPSNKHLFTDTSKYTISQIPSSRAIFINYNLSHPVINDEAVRQAINLSMDKDTYCHVLLNDSAVAATGLFPDYLPYSGQKLQNPKFNLEAAKAALDKAGWMVGSDGIRQKNGQKLTLNLTTYSSRVELPIIAEALQSQLQDIGFDVKLEVLESVEDQLKSGNFEAIIYSYVTTPLGDPQTMLENLFKTGGAYNAGKYSDPQTDKMIDELAKEYDPNKRSDLAVSIVQRAIDKNAFGFIAHLKLSIVTKKGVVGLEKNPSDIYGVNAETDIIN
jgi:peptide/nickel transport system substrate-binding protein